MGTKPESCCDRIKSKGTYVLPLKYVLEYTQPIYNQAIRANNICHFSYLGFIVCLTHQSHWLDF